MIVTLLLLAASPTPAAVAPRVERRTVAAAATRANAARRAQRLRELTEVVRALPETGTARSGGGDPGPKGL